MQMAFSIYNHGHCPPMRIGIKLPPHPCQHKHGRGAMKEYCTLMENQRFFQCSFPLFLALTMDISVVFMIKRRTP